MTNVNFNQILGPPRTRCGLGEGPLWCFVMGGPSAVDYQIAQWQLSKQMSERIRVDQ